MKYCESFEMRNVYGKFRKIKRNRTSNIPSIRKRETSAFENLKESKKKEKIEPRYVALIRKRGTSAWEN